MAFDHVAKPKSHAAPARQSTAGTGGPAGLHNGARAASLSTLSAHLNGPGDQAPIQMMRFGKAPRFQQTFTSRTGLQGIVLGQGGGGGRGRVVRPQPAAEPESSDPEDHSQAHQEEEEHQEPQPLLAALEEHQEPQPLLAPLVGPGHSGPLPTPAQLHDHAAGLLGERVNDDPSEFHELDAGTLGTVKAGNAASFKIIKEIAKRRGIDPEKADPRELMIHHAAVGHETGIGVCDIFAAVTATEARLAGHDSVLTRGRGGHRWAVVGGQTVDAWANRVHSDKPNANNTPQNDTDISKENPEDLGRDLMKERAKVRELLPGILEEHLSSAEMQSYHDLMALRGKNGGYGTLKLRHLAEERAITHGKAAEEAKRKEREEERARLKADQAAMEAAREAREAREAEAEGGGPVKLSKEEQIKKREEERAKMREAMAKAKAAKKKDKDPEPGPEDGPQ
jgi:hypothetical protein